MPQTLGRQALMSKLKSKSAALGLTLLDDGKDGLGGDVEKIRAKWFLGGRKVIYRVSCRAQEAEHVIVFREAVFETSWGLAPPTFTVEKEILSGWKRSGQRTDISVGGGGAIDYAVIRNAMEEATVEAGWQFRHEGGRLP
jgi:hypothetical protein